MAAAAPTHIEYALVRAVADLNVHETDQTIDIRTITTLNGVHMQYMVDFLRRNVREMKKLSLVLGANITDPAVEILRAYLAELATTNTMHYFSLRGAENLGNERGARLLSGLHGSPTVTYLSVGPVGLQGRAGGDILAALLQNLPVLATLECLDNPLGVEGARALQPGIRASGQTMKALLLPRCSLGNAGVQAIVDVLCEGNSTIGVLSLYGNEITANDGLPQLTRLLQDSPVKMIGLGDNPGLFDDEENTRLFSIALQNKTMVMDVSFNRCEIPGPAVMALFQATARNKNSTRFVAYDHVRLEGQDLDRLLEMIRNTRHHPLEFRINLDFRNKAVLSAFHANTEIMRLYDVNNQCITDGPIADILKRNQLLANARALLDSERSEKTIPLGLWAKAMECLMTTHGDDNNNDDDDNDDNSNGIVVVRVGATATYTILREKLVRTPPLLQQQQQEEAATTAAAAATTAAPSAAMMKRSYTHSSMNNDDNENDGNDETDEAMSSVASLEPQHKRSHEVFLSIPVFQLVLKTTDSKKIKTIAKTTS